ncbi:MAG: 16S rRNA (cytosine(1402)-N(4))-methyltransferase RsmH [Deltaproteobacteria bacterium]|nr:16S rRNA (cytosine(1402)-N(4))-methyltransferase RsmH [Deltaproteobacteria bacterium]
MSRFVHEPVLVDEVIRFLAPRPGRIYCDGTVGGGGHALRILEASAPDGRLVGIDRDPSALEAAGETLKPFAGRVTLVHATLGRMAQVLEDQGTPAVDGILLDLGVSSPQLDVAERGFSFSKEGPLDMRMDPTTGETAEDLLRRVSASELERILREYGEERYASRISRAIKEALRKGEVSTTTELARVVRRAMPHGAARRERIDPATRTFQALRIAVNRELEELGEFLRVFPELLNPGGRLVVISFHSLEDRMVKERMRELGWTSRLPRDLAQAAGERTEPTCRTLTRKPVTASDLEVARNPRARSAKLRACEKTEEGDP